MQRPPSSGNSCWPEVPNFWCLYVALDQRVLPFTGKLFVINFRCSADRLSQNSWYWYHISEPGDSNRNEAFSWSSSGDSPWKDIWRHVQNIMLKMPLTDPPRASRLQAFRAVCNPARGSQRSNAGSPFEYEGLDYVQIWCPKFGFLYSYAWEIHDTELCNDWGSLLLVLLCATAQQSCCRHVGVRRPFVRKTRFLGNRQAD